jgi:hypothetical protein
MSENKKTIILSPNQQKREVMMIKKIQLQAKIVQLTSKSFPVWHHRLAAGQTCHYGQAGHV